MTSVRLMTDADTAQVISKRLGVKCYLNRGNYSEARVYLNDVTPFTLRDLANAIERE